MSASTEAGSWDRAIKAVIDDTFKNFASSTPSYTDIILREFIEERASQISFVHKLKFVQMKIGAIWQRIFGMLEGVDDLGVGHESGLDLKGREVDGIRACFIMELKNSYNTDNASSRSRNLSKLIAYVSEHPECEAIYAYINCKTPAGEDYKKKVNRVTVRFLSGEKLMRFMLASDDKYDETVQSIKRHIKPYLESM